MIKITKDIQLQSISLVDQSVLYNLMKRIYPPAYQHYWQDGGNWYVNDLYTLENVQKELNENNAHYYFVLFRNQIIGIFRIVYQVDPYNQKEESFVKLHRLYLDQSIQNKGIGRHLMIWLIDQLKKEGYPKLWLDAMEKQPQALHFYQKLGFEIIDKVALDFPLLIDKYRGMYKMIKTLD
jgi:GNAT superfamily N-acetyltransferase